MSFHFSCHRCGNCCRVGHGQVWFEARDLPAMAASLDMTEEAFAQRFVRRVGERLSLREHADGRCMMLDGQAHCSIYEHRPAQCRDFPYWPQLESSAQALQETAAYCAGIQLFPEVDIVAPTLQAAAELLDAALARQVEEGKRREAEEPGSTGERWGSSLEVDLYLATAQDRQVRQPELVEEVRRALEELAQRSGYPWSVAPWERLLADRRAGWLARNGLPTLVS